MSSSVAEQYQDTTFFHKLLIIARRKRKKRGGSVLVDVSCYIDDKIFGQKRGIVVLDQDCRYRFDCSPACCGKMEYQGSWYLRGTGWYYWFCFVMWSVVLVCWCHVVFFHRIS